MGAGWLDDHGGDVGVALQRTADGVDVAGRQAVERFHRLPRDAEGRRDVVVRHTLAPETTSCQPWKWSSNLISLRAAGEGAGEADRHHRRLGAGAVEAHLLATGDEVDDLPRPLDLEAVGGAVVGAGLHLLRDRRDHIRVAVAEDEGAVAHDVVDQLVAVGVPFVAALGAVDVDREGVEAAGVVGQAAGKDLQAPGSRALLTRGACAGIRPRSRAWRQSTTKQQDGDARPQEDEADLHPDAGLIRSRS